jgi:transcriptional regulator with XRE-family HTH domain
MIEVCRKLQTFEERRACRNKKTRGLLHYRAPVVSNQDLVDGRRAALGERLRVLRRRSNLTQAELAAAAGMHRTFLTEVETARHSITLDRVHALADALRVTIHQLLPSDEDALIALGRADRSHVLPERMVIIELDEQAYQCIADAAAQAGLRVADVARRAVEAAYDPPSAGEGELGEC